MSWWNRKKTVNVETVKQAVKEDKYAQTVYHSNHVMEQVQESFMVSVPADAPESEHEEMKAHLVRYVRARGWITSKEEVTILEEQVGEGENVFIHYIIPTATRITGTGYNHLVYPNIVYVD